MKRLMKLVACVVLGLAGSMVGQTSFYTDRAVATTPVNGQSVLVPIGYGQVRVCTSAATGSPCTPVAAITDLNGNPLSVVGGNFGQVTTDVVGRFNFGCQTGNYIVQVAPTGSNTPQLNYKITCPQTNGPLTSPTINGFFFVDGTTYITPQQAISAACAFGGGTVFISPGVYAQNGPFALCSNLNIIGAGRCQVDAVNCPTLITTTMTTGDLFPITNMTDIHLADFGVKATASGANAFIRLNYGQRVVAERLYLSGPFAVGIELDSSLGSLGSTIWNSFRDIHNNLLAPNGIGCLIDTHNATDKVVNNNTFDNVTCSGGSSGASAGGVVIRNSNQFQNANENWFKCGEAASFNGAGGGTGVLITQAATGNTTFQSCNIENNLIGVNIASGNTVSFIASGIQANGTNILAEPRTSTQHIGGRVGGVVPVLGVDKGGNIIANSFTIGTVAPDPGNLNGTDNGGCWAIEANGNVRQLVCNSGIGIDATNGLQVDTSMAQGGTGFKHARGTTGSIAATTRADITLSWGGTVFANTNYSVTCSIEESTVAAGTQSLVVERIHNKNVGSIVVSVFNGTGGALTGTLDCLAAHD
jgi:hypothetical protein